MNRKMASYLLLAIALVGFGLRCYALEARSMWFDESVSYVTVTRFSGIDIIEKTAQAVHPPFYYLLLDAWASAFGPSLFSLRFMSVLLGTATSIAAYFFSCEVFSRTAEQNHDKDYQRGVGIFAALLVATSSFHIVWSQQARMYSLGTFLTLYSSYVLLAAMRSRHLTSWVLYAVSASALMYTHNYGLFTVLAQWIYLAFICVRRTDLNYQSICRSQIVRRSVLCISLAGLSYLPWLPVVIQQSQQVKEDYWIKTFNIWTVPFAFQDLFLPHNPLSRESKIIPFLICTALAFAVFNATRRAGEKGVLIALLVATPVLASVLISVFISPIVVTRYYLFAQSAVLCALAHLFWELSILVGRRAKVVLWPGILAIVCVNTLYVHNLYWNELDITGTPGLRGVINHVLAVRNTDEPIVVVHPAIYYSTLYHSRNHDVNPKLYATEELTSYNGKPLLLSEDLITEIELDSHKHHAIWVIDSDGFSGSFSAFRLPEPWSSDADTSMIYPEVFQYQGAVSGTKYQHSK